MLFTFYYSGETITSRPETLHNSVSTKQWDDPWPQEIDWLDPYFNLSAVSQEILDGIALGNRFTKFIRNDSSPKFGWYAAIKINHNLADSYYIKHYMHTNKTMFMCVPYFGKWNFVIAYGWVDCKNYTLGKFKGEGDWSYIFSDAYGGVRLKLALMAVGFIAITGLFGKFLTVSCGIHHHHWVVW